METLSGLLTPVIACGMLYIAYQQWRTNENKWRFDRYDKRLKVYQEVTKTLSVIMGTVHPEMPDLFEFRKQTAEADFIFGPEIPEYIEEIFRRGTKLHYANEQYRDITQTPPPGYDHEAVVKQMHEQIDWIAAQFPIAREKFKKYLDVSR
jgi:hypothetical protein